MGWKAPVIIYHEGTKDTKVTKNTQELLFFIIHLFSGQPATRS